MSNSDEQAGEQADQRHDHQTAERTFPFPISRPRLRGVSHLWAFFVSVPLGLLLLALSPTPRAMFAAAVYALSLPALFGTSALYHRGQWSLRAKALMRRLDHSMIFVLIAGTYTPVVMLALEGPHAAVLLTAVWGAAGVGVLLKLFWQDLPEWLSVSVYLVLGWVGSLALPELGRNIGLLPLLVFALGGVLYSIGAVVYFLRRPDPLPRVFGYHEVFHALVIAGAAMHYGVIATCVVPV